MRICLLLVIITDESFNINIASALSVHHRNTCAVIDRKAHLEATCWLGLEIPDFANITALSCRVNIHPEVYHTLVKRATLMLELTSLNRFLFDCDPLRVKEAIIEIDRSLANQIITEEQVIIVCLDNERWCSWEADIEVISLVEFWIWLIVLVVFLLVKLSVTTTNNKVRIAR